MELGSTNTTEQTCCSIICWLVWHLMFAFLFFMYVLIISASLSFALSSLQIQNGIAIYATWTTIASLLNLTIVLTYDASMSHADGATLALSVLSIVLIAW